MNIQVSRANNRNLTKKNFTHDANLTMPFGEVSSIYSKEMNPRSTIKIEHKDLVRLAPMVTPTFGRVFYKTYSRFIPYADIWNPFPFFLDSKKFNSGVSTYIPTKVPQVSIQKLTGWLLSTNHTSTFQTCYVSAWSASGVNVSPSECSALDITKLTRTSNPTFAGLIQSFAPYLLSTFGIDVSNISAGASLLDDPTGCDFTVILEGSNYGLSQDDNIVIGFNLTHYGKHLRSILMSLGYALDLNNTRMVSILPLISWYKGYYDLFVPSHNGTSDNIWTDTNAYGLMQYLADYNYNDVNTNTTSQNYWKGFLMDVCNSYYYQKADFFGSHISTPTITNNSSVPKYNVSYNGMSMSDQFNSGTIGPNKVPMMYYSSNAYLADSIRLLLKMTPFINIDTIFGGRLDKAMKAKFGDDYKSLFVSYDAGRGSTFCQIDDIMSTADTATGVGGAYLGEYAGKGIGSNVSGDGKGDFFKYSANTYGIIIVYACIVPESKFVNGLDYNVTHGIDNKYSFYHSQFDALGNVVNQKDILIGNRYNAFIQPDDADSTDLSKQNYGLIPRYSEMKSQACGLNTGDLSLPSLRNSMQPFTLDKLIDSNVCATSYTEGHGTDFSIYPGQINVANPEYLTIGKYRWMGRYNRIFVNDADDNEVHASRHTEDVTDYVGNMISSDNFIIHNILDIEYYGPEIPMEDSFDTDSEGKDTMNVEKL